MKAEVLTAQMRQRNGREAVDVRVCQDDGRVIAEMSVTFTSYGEPYKITVRLPHGQFDRGREYAFGEVPRASNQDRTPVDVDPAKRPK